MTNKTTGIARLVAATRYSINGLVAALRHEEAFRLELVISLFLIPLAWWLGKSPIEKALLIGSIVLIIIFELINSAIEAVVDRIGSDHHELSGRAKDLGSAAVFLCIVNAVMVWFLILV